MIKFIICGLTAVFMFIATLLICYFMVHINKDFTLFIVSITLILGGCTSTFLYYLLAMEGLRSHNQNQNIFDDILDS